MEEIKKLVEQILLNGYVMSLATLDDGGTWVSDVVYVYDDNFNIYWVSQVSTRHSKAIEKNSEVSATITTSVLGGKNEGLQIEGVARRVGKPNFETVLKHLHKRFGDVPHIMRTDENGNLKEAAMSWYMLKPKKIELIYEKYYGFDKQVLNF